MQIIQKYEQNIGSTLNYAPLRPVAEARLQDTNKNEATTPRQRKECENIEEMLQMLARPEHMLLEPLRYTDTELQLLAGADLVPAAVIEDIVEKIFLGQSRIQILGGTRLYNDIIKLLCYKQLKDKDYELDVYFEPAELFARQKASTLDILCIKQDNEDLPTPCCTFCDAVDDEIYSMAISLECLREGSVIVELLLRNEGSLLDAGVDSVDSCFGVSGFRNRLFDNNDKELYYHITKKMDDMLLVERSSTIFLLPAIMWYSFAITLEAKAMSFKLTTFKSMAEDKSSIKQYVIEKNGSHADNENEIFRLPLPELDIIRRCNSWREYLNKLNLYQGNVIFNKLFKVQFVFYKNGQSARAKQLLYAHSRVEHFQDMCNIFLESHNSVLHVVKSKIVFYAEPGASFDELLEGNMLDSEFAKTLLDIEKDDSLKNDLQKELDYYYRLTDELTCINECIELLSSLKKDLLDYTDEDLDLLSKHAAMFDKMPFGIAFEGVASPYTDEETVDFYSSCILEAYDETIAQINNAEATGKPPAPKEQETAQTGLDFAELSSHLKRTVIGQDEIVDACINTIKVDSSPLKTKTSPTSFLFAGPTGTGKTFLAEQLAAGLDLPLIRLDMSEFHDTSALNRLIGSPPGYFGSNTDAQLVSWVKKNPQALIIFDEVDKADPKVLDILLQILDKGEFSSGKGDKYNIASSVIVCTTNASQAEINKARNPVGFTGTTGDNASIGQEGIRKAFRPELINRFSKILVFNSFTKQSIQMLVATKLEDKFGEWRESFNLHVQLDDAAMAALCQLSLDDAYGARELTRVIDKVIINKIIDLLAPNFDDKTVKISSAYSPESLGAKEALYNSFSYEVIDLPESGTA